MRFPPSFIDRVRNHFLLSEVIGRRVSLKRHGREYQALCPFHNEKTPSFTVNDEKNFYHCFGCGAHGDAFGFIMQHERASYPEAIELLAREAGIALPNFSPEEQKKAQAEKTLYDVLDAAGRWFSGQLYSSSNIHAQNYAARRGLQPETLSTFGIGYAPNTSKTALCQHLSGLGFSKAMQAEAGLIIQPDEGDAYDRFRGRLMFPIRSASGKIVAFGGRLIVDDPEKRLPKYLNSPETPLFKKGEMLFNFDLAKRPAREADRIVVMEGYMDVVMSAQAGVADAVATLGTAITPEHLRLLWQLSKEPILCLDGDAAGKRAMLRGIEIALPHMKAGCGLKFAVLPAGEDPDSYVQKHGKAQFDALFAAARPLSQVIWETLKPQFKLDTPEGRAGLEAAITKLCAQIGEASVRQHYQSYFKNRLWEAVRQKKKTGLAAGGRSPRVEHVAAQDHAAVFEALAARMLHALAQFPALLHKSHVEETLLRLDIRSISLESLRTALLSAASHVDIDDAAAFDSYLRAALPGGLPEKPMRLPYQNTLTLEDALILWNETAETYQQSHLEFELKEAEEQFSRLMDEASYQRLLEIKQAIESSRRARSFAPAEIDAA